ncbi:hypothetical protein VCR15J2_390109 [Vibrio coralliirubri]|uniref:hypothetical protein n=1 Tax=Vibrio coralliirubri TaxID=1516159 RepID=UPI0006366368|nr:hypothetical protein [Vibrio coralliirubri]CDT53875.1 hypothetical protein VCR15J2_390109 [Vibrio coralliirubri]
MRHERLSGANVSASCKNTHIIGCGALNRRCHYSICVNFLMAVEENRIGESFPDCQTALRKGECIAFTMREEEKEVGKGLYFVERKEVIKTPIAKPYSSTSKRRSFSSTTKPTPQKSKPKSIDEEMMGSDMSVAINAAIHRESKTPSVIKPKKGETPIQFAKRYSRGNK